MKVGDIPATCILPQPYYERDGIVLYHGDALALLPLLEFDLMLTVLRMKCGRGG